MSEVKSAVSLKSILGRGIGGGKEKRREFRSKLAVGDSLLEDISISLALPFNFGIALHNTYVLWDNG